MKFITNHCCIKVSDLENSRAFYEKAIGYKIDYVCHHTDTVTSYFMGDGVTPSQLQLLALPGYVPEHQAFGHFSVSTADIRAAHAHHSEMGCATGPVVDQGHQCSYFIRDPDGYETEVIQPK